MAAQVTRSGTAGATGAVGHPPESCRFVDFTDSLRWLAWHTTSPGCVVCTRRWAMVGCISTPRTACCCPTPWPPPVSTAFRGSMTTTVGPHPSAQRSAAVLDAARQAVADLVNADPRGVVLGADRAILLNSLADASSSRVGLGYEMVVTRLDDEANIAPWLRAANRYGAKVKWAEVDIETGELPTWQWENLITEPTRLVAITSASSTLGTVTDLRAVTKLMHEDGGLVIVDHSAAAPYRLIDIDEIDADVVAVNALGVGRTADRRAGVPRPVDDRLVQLDRAEPVCHRPRAARDRRAPVRPARRPRRQHRVPGLALTSRRTGTRRERLAVSMQSAVVLHDQAVRLPVDVAAVAAARSW